MKLNNLEELKGKMITINKDLITGDKKDEYIGSVRRFRFKK